MVILLMEVNEENVIADNWGLCIIHYLGYLKEILPKVIMKRKVFFK